MNRMTIKLFATLRERAGASELSREFPDGATVAEMWQRLAEEFPGLKGHRDSVGFAVNQEYVPDDYRPRPGDEVAFIPPVSGGAAPARDPGWVGPIAIGRTPIDVAALERAVADPHAGAIVTFAGTTRADNAGRNVIRLEYEAYESMALTKMREIGAQAHERFSIDRVAIAHRLGRLEIGETSVFIAVSAPHRAAAFDACRFAIDTLKKTVPIWKKEFFADGAVWADGEIPPAPPIRVEPAS